MKLDNYWKVHIIHIHIAHWMEQIMHAEMAYSQWALNTQIFLKTKRLHFIMAFCYDKIWSLQYILTGFYRKKRPTFMLHAVIFCFHLKNVQIFDGTFNLHHIYHLHVFSLFIATSNFTQRKILRTFHWLCWEMVRIFLLICDRYILLICFGQFTCHELYCYNP